MQPSSGEVLTIERGGRQVTAHRAGSSAAGAPLVLMHYGTPHTGAHPPVVVRHADRLGLALLSVTRPGYPGSDPLPGRSVADAADDARAVVEHLGVDRMRIVGYSGGGPHALALASRWGDRVDDVAVFACPAPYSGRPDWFSGMAAGGGGLRAALDGRAARERYQQEAEFDPEIFTRADRAALGAQWADIGADAQSAGRAGSSAGEIDDDLAFVNPWGVDLATVTAEVTLVQADDDRIIPAAHADLIAARLSRPRLHRVAGSGHVAVLDALPDWLAGAG